MVFAAECQISALFFLQKASKYGAETPAALAIKRLNQLNFCKKGLV